MTKRQAIKECKELWGEIEKSGKTKYGFLDSPAGAKWLAKDYESNCSLCDYAKSECPEEEDSCSYCPLMTQYGEYCYALGFRDPIDYSLPSFFEVVRGLK